MTFARFWSLNINLVDDVTLSSVKQVCYYTQTLATAAVPHAALHNTMHAATVCLPATQRTLCEPNV